MIAGDSDSKNKGSISGRKECEERVELVLILLLDLYLSLSSILISTSKLSFCST